MNVEKRMQIEKRIVREACKALDKAGYLFRLHDGEEYATGITNDPKIITDEMHACDEEMILVYNQFCARIGSIQLVYGNDGWDVLADHSVNLEDVLKPVYDLCDRICEEES